MATKPKTRGVDLDDPASFAKVDRQDQLGRLERFGEDLEEASRSARKAAPGFRKAGRYVSSVVVAGMGGSAIAGEVAADAFRGALPVPMAVVQDYELPAFARRETLVIASSYSGTTEETLSMFEDGLRRGCRVVGITSGGTLKERLKEQGLPCFDLPPGIMPRAAMPFLLAPVVEILERAELLVGSSPVEETVQVAREVARSCARTRPTRTNRAKRVAESLFGGTPVIYGSGVLRSAALRWRTQLNENAKVLAASDLFPASNHNDINAWGGDPRAGDFRVVVLRDRKEHPRTSRRVELTKKLAFRGRAGTVTEVEAAGQSALARAVSAILVGDFTSVYLALKRGVDPTPVDVIVKLKDQLSKA